MILEETLQIRNNRINIPVTVSGIHSHSKTSKCMVIHNLLLSRGTMTRTLTLQAVKNRQHDTSRQSVRPNHQDYVSSCLDHIQAGRVDRHPRDHQICRPLVFLIPLPDPTQPSGDFIWWGVSTPDIINSFGSNDNRKICAGNNASPLSPTNARFQHSKFMCFMKGNVALIL